MNSPQNESYTTATVRLLRHIFGEELGLLQVWTGVRGPEGEISPNTIRFEHFNYPRAMQTAAQWAHEKAEEGREVYFCAHLLTRPRRVKENAAAVLTLWGELDGAEVPNGSLRPSAIVESSPGHYHVYWRLTDPISPEMAEQLNKRLAHEIGADPSGFDLSQLLRIPDTVNHKYPDHPRVRVLDIEDSRTYSPAELDALLPELVEPKAEEHEADESEEEPPVVLDPEALKVWRGEKPKLKDDGAINRSASLVKIGRILYDAGANRSVILAALRERDIALGWRCYTDRSDAGKRYAEIFEELKKNGRNSRVSIAFGSRKEKKPELPKMEEAAYRGLFGSIVELVEPHTEADPVAVLASALVAVGNALGRGPFVQVGATQHHTNLFVGIVGDTATSRKGSSWDPVENIMHGSDRRWCEQRIASGLSSGEGLIAEVRDPVEVPGKDGKMEVVDQGVSDKRLLVQEGELAQALKVMLRQGNTLSPTLRNAWDGKSLRTLVRHSPLRATKPHVSILGHITKAELVRHLTEIEMANGLANRFLWLLVRRSKSLPFGGSWYEVDLEPISREITTVIEYANKTFRLAWAENAKPLWTEAYKRLTEDRAGMFGAVTARAEAQTLRLAMLYALVDGSQYIRESHVESALAVWEYAEESARLIFGDAVGDPDADKVLDALKRAKRGLTRTEVRDLFGRNKGTEEIDRILKVLLEAGRVRVTKSHKAGSNKPVEGWFAV
jgi:hypothetical protein